MVLRVDEIEATRARRFEDLRTHHKAKAPEAPEEGRWAVLKGRPPWGKLLVRAGTREDAEELAGAQIDEGWEPIALFDLDELAGEAPIMVTADYDGRSWMVHGAQRVGGKLTGAVVLKMVGGSGTKWDWATARPDQLTNIEWSGPDERLPVRYDVAGVRKVVAFNTIASP